MRTSENKFHNFLAWVITAVSALSNLIILYIFIGHKCACLREGTPIIFSDEFLDIARSVVK